MFTVAFPKSSPLYFVSSTLRDDYILRVIAETDQFYETKVLQLLNSMPIGPGAIVDAGANVGNHTLFFAKVMGRRVYAFEAAPTIRTALCDTVVRNKLTSRVEILNKGLSSKAEAGTIAIHSKNLGMSRLFIGNSEISQEYEGRELVELVALDAALKGETDRIALIKIDVEGHEAAVLDGSIETIKKSRPVILVEVHDHQALQRVHDFMVSLRYRLLSVVGKSRNYLYCHEEVHAVLSAYVSGDQFHQTGLILDAQAHSLRVSDERLQTAMKEVDHLRSLNASLALRLAKVEYQVLQARAELAATGKEVKVPDVQKRAAELKLYKERFAEVATELEMWKDRSVTLNDVNKNISKKYKNKEALAERRKNMIDELNLQIENLKMK